jgi:hypothetical protein
MTKHTCNSNKIDLQSGDEGNNELQPSGLTNNNQPSLKVWGTNLLPTNPSLYTTKSPRSLNEQLMPTYFPIYLS